MEKANEKLTEKATEKLTEKATEKVLTRRPGLLMLMVIPGWPRLSRSGHEGAQWRMRNEKHAGNGKNGKGPGLNPANGASRPEGSGLRRWIACLLALLLVATAVAVVWWHTRRQPAGRTPAESAANNPALETMPGSPTQTEPPSTAPAGTVPTKAPFMSQTNMPVLPIVNVPPITNAPSTAETTEQSLRSRIQELEERNRQLEEALAATKAPATQPAASHYPYPPTPGTWVATDGTAARFTISPMTEGGPWLKIQAWGFRNGGRDWGAVPLGYGRSHSLPVGFAAWHNDGGNFFLILRFKQLGIDAEEVFLVDGPPNASPKVVVAQQFFVPQYVGDGP